MVVDDNPTNLMPLRNILAAEGYQIILAFDGQQALQLAQAQKPDLILLDILMPEMDGFEVCQQLKDHPTTQHIPIIFISALGDKESIAKGFALGAADYIPVPFQVSEVMARVRHQAQLLEQRRQIEQHYENLNAVRNEFIQSAAHDLKNPLHTIQNYARLLNEHEDLAHSEEARRYVQRILLSTQRMWNLVTDMLDMAYLDKNETLYFQEASINQILMRVIYEFDQEASKRNVILVSELLDEDIITQVDAKAILRVLENLLSNALKYTPLGKQILLRAWTEDAALLVSVSDEGLGIAPQELSRIFEPFYRSSQREVQEVEGSGLGLSIVKRIVEQHGGSVSVESTIGRGTTFTVRLPIRDGA